MMDQERSSRSSHSPAPRLRQVTACLGQAAALTAGISVLSVLSTALILDQAFLIWAIRGAIIVLIAGLGWAIALGLLWLHNRVRRAAIITLQHGQPVHVADVRSLTQATAVTTLGHHYAVELARAEHSAFPALTHYSVRGTGDAAGARAPALEGEVINLPTAPTAVPSLPQLHAQGFLSGGMLLAGLSGASPLTIDMKTCGFIAVGGQSRSGKSHTVALLIAQAALQGWDIALCDPFPHKPDGLMSLCQPLSGTIFRQAGAPNEIARTIQLIDKVGRRRLDGDRWERPLLLVIEEFSNLVIRGMLPAEILDLLPAMAMAYAAVGVHAVIVGHEFSRSLLGERYGATLRRACTHRIAHRLAPDAAEFLLPSASYVRQVVDLQPGRALLWGEDSPQLISIPKVGVPDLIFAAQGRPPRPYTPWSVTQPAMAAPPPPTPASLDDRIVALLQGTHAALDSNAIATQLGADLQQVRNALTRLSHAGRINRHGTPRSYTYGALTS